MICTELYHGQTLTVVVVTLFRGTPLKYVSDLIDLLLMCFVCIISKAGIVHVFLEYSAMESRISSSTHLSGIVIFRKQRESTFSGTRVNVLARNPAANFIKNPDNVLRWSSPKQHEILIDDIHPKVAWALALHDNGRIWNTLLFVLLQFSLLLPSLPC
jgi:hypothetical protein